MNLIFQNENFAVFDDFLDHKSIQFVWNYFQSVDFEFVQVKKWVKVNRLSDGNSLFGSVQYSEQVKGVIDGMTYPSGSGLDLVSKKIMENLGNFEPWIGKKGNDWEFFFVRPYLYPQGTGLSWHDDYTQVAGAFTLYVHPYWNVQWGAELLIADSSTKNMKRPKYKLFGIEDDQLIGPYLDNKDENEKLLEFGIGYFIHPKPNRFVLIASGVQHTIKKVDITAGDHCRCAIAGFFIAQNKVDIRI